MEEAHSYSQVHPSSFKLLPGWFCPSENTKKGWELLPLLCAGPESCPEIIPITGSVQGLVLSSPPHQSQGIAEERSLPMLLLAALGQVNP